jgi:2-polyprenyl-3-methyl-5-hydroxy-6-metoxy-1,4-benzoquinol methylase
MQLTGDLDDRIRELARRFDVTPAFLATYLETRPHVRVPIEQAVDEADMFDKLGPLTGMYVRFALTTTERGRTFLELVSPHCASPKRFLDVGCAFGGFMRALRRRGAEVVGVEIDEALARLATLNLRDLGGDVRQGDILATPAGTLGTFDLIACNDVIEHVASAAALVRTVSNLLAPGGIAYFEIPNRDAIAHVTSDGHFQQFGLTLLPRDVAARVLHEATGKRYDDMGEMHAEAQYLQWFDEAGLRPLHVPQQHAQSRGVMNEQIFNLVNAFTWWHDHQRKALSEDLGDAIVERYWAYTATLFNAVAAARRSGDWRSFERRYLSPFWTFVLQK